ncbi:MAG: hypothetical protein PVF90_00890 [Gemmatimonadota bacterium]|jgi:hypothetical protein
MCNRRICSVALAGLLVAACNAAPEAENAQSGFELVGDTQELMAHIIDPAADVYWAAGGVIVDAEGEHFQIPENDEEWMALSNAALTIAESGNLLMMDGRAVDQGAWVTMSKELIDVGRQALEAADARNLDAVFDMGAEIYYVCTNCHSAYALETLRPNDDRTN